MTLNAKGLRCRHDYRKILTNFCTDLCVKLHLVLESLGFTIMRPFAVQSHLRVFNQVYVIRDTIGNLRTVGQHAIRSLIIKNMIDQVESIVFKYKHCISQEKIHGEFQAATYCTWSKYSSDLYNIEVTMALFVRAEFDPKKGDSSIFHVRNFNATEMNIM